MNSVNPWLENEQPRVPLRGYAIGAAFVVLAAWLAFASPDIAVPDHATPSFDTSLIGSAPPRRMLALPASIAVAGYQLACMECHRLFEPPRSGVRGTPIQHRSIHLDHGLNAQCLNCHDRDDRSRLSVRGGPSLPFSDAPLLCAGCHGPTYRDWFAGIHGRTNGYWNASKGQPRRLQCTECHDPHAPAFAPMSLLPGPHTLRLDAGSSVHAAERPLSDNPLRRGTQRAADDSAAGSSSGGDN